MPSVFSRTLFSLARCSHCKVSSLQGFSHSVWACRWTLHCRSESLACTIWATGGVVVMWGQVGSYNLEEAAWGWSSLLHCSHGGFQAAAASRLCGAWVGCSCCKSSSACSLTAQVMRSSYVLCVSGFCHKLSRVSKSAVPMDGFTSVDRVSGAGAKSDCIENRVTSWERAPCPCDVLQQPRATFCLAEVLSSWCSLGLCW